MQTRRVSCIVAQWCKNRKVFSVHPSCLQPNISLKMLQEQPLEEQVFQSIDPDQKTHLFLNDETINKYMDLITERSPDTVYAFNTFFYSSFIKNGYPHICRWTKKVDIFEKKKLFIPVHIEEDLHWCLVCVDFEKKMIKYYDSLGARNFFCLKQILRYLMYESKDKKNEEFDVGGYSLMNMRKCPKQNNLWDCGVFVCMFAEHLSRDAPLKFTQKDMKRFRKQISYEIKKKKLVNCVKNTKTMCYNSV